MSAIARIRKKSKEGDDGDGKCRVEMENVAFYSDPRSPKHVHAIRPSQFNFDMHASDAIGLRESSLGFSSLRAGFPAIFDFASFGLTVNDSYVRDRRDRVPVVLSAEE